MKNKSNSIAFAKPGTDRGKKKQELSFIASPVRNSVFIFLLILCGSFSIHKYYHSHCTFELNAKTGGAEIVLELFHHDLEVSLSKKNNKTIKIDDKDLNIYVKAYLEENFILKNAEGKVVEFDFVGTELKNDELSIFFEYKNLKSVTGFSLTNSVLVREFPTQINKVNFKSGDWKKTLVYSKKVIEQKI